ncbi:class I SAM-dependent methyltransferase [Caenimonas sedimenti]|uniref:Class I SAM-dependent methyltransferase n=1 Tax=Caenimonas sedimenti TaxID=2596921 RepID=A0A562ZMX5_9BURK|nr:class I SAM-dependent methyltransferase [Caenimonas sedimenti]TWO69655.1 class I SAM-dependent methyltransferase [Caenimonas sedimenti]
MRRRARILQIVNDHARKPMNHLRVLDIASLEGDYSVEFALRGAQVLGVEGRRTNVERASARFDMPNLKFVQDDVRNISRAKYGEFDVVLCLGILYHLDAPDCFKLLDAIADVCTGVAVIDTHVSARRSETVQYKGREYSGWRYREYVQAPSAEEEESSTWASIGNVHSFWPTRPSLVNAIAEAGFTSVTECQYPAWNDIPADRVAMVAIKGERQKVLGSPFDEALLAERVDEVPRVSAVAPRAAIKMQAKRVARWFGVR